MSKNIVLIVGDNAQQMTQYALTLPQNYEVHFGDCATDGLAYIQQLGNEDVSEIIITWNTMTAEQGKALFAKMRKHCPHAAILIVASNPELRKVIDSMKLLPSRNILSRPFSAGVFRIHVQEVMPQSKTAMKALRVSQQAPKMPAALTLATA